MSQNPTGKQPRFTGWNLHSTMKGVKFQRWDDLEDYDRLVWIQKFIYDLIDPIDLRSPEERDSKSHMFKKDYRQVKLSRWKKAYKEGTLGSNLDMIEYYYEHELMKFQLSDRQKTEIQRNTELKCLKRENQLLKEKNKEYETIEAKYEDLLWENMTLKQDKEKVETRLQVVSDARDRACEYIQQLKRKINKLDRQIQNLKN